MQIMAGIVVLGPGAAGLDDMSYSIDSLRDCEASLLPYYANKLGVWEPGHSATLRVL